MTQHKGRSRAPGYRSPVNDPSETATPSENSWRPMQQPARERPGPDARPDLSEPQALAQPGAGALGGAGLGAPLR